MSHSELVASILLNPCNHMINRDKKMSETVEVMANNLQKKVDEKENYLIDSANQVTVNDTDYGYNKGHGRGTGD